MKDLDKSNPFLQKCLPHRSQNVNIFWITMFILIQLRMSPTSSLSMEIVSCMPSEFEKTWYHLIFGLCFLFHRRSSIHSRDIEIFTPTSSSLFSHVVHCWEYRIKLNDDKSEGFDIIICVNRNFKKKCLISWEVKNVWYWNLINWQKIIKRKFSWKEYVENAHQKIVPDHHLILVKS